MGPSTSAFGYKQTFHRTVIYVRFTPESGHPRRDVLMGAMVACMHGSPEPPLPLKGRTIW